MESIELSVGRFAFLVERRGDAVGTDFNCHRAIAKAISQSKPNAARDAMRRHLERGLKRYRSMADEAA